MSGLAGRWPFGVSAAWRPLVAVAVVALLLWACRGDVRRAAASLWWLVTGGPRFDRLARELAETRAELALARHVLEERGIVRVLGERSV